MIINTETTIMFRVPEEHDAMMEFIMTMDMSKWTQESISGFYIFRNKESVNTEVSHK